MRARRKEIPLGCGDETLLSELPAVWSGIPEREPRRIGKANAAPRAEIGGAGLDPYPSDPTYIPKKGHILLKKGLKCENSGCII